MKSFIRVCSVFLLAGVVLTSCEKDPPEDENYQEEFTGTWNVLEKTGINSPQSYQVEIRPGSHPDQIIIDGLYNNPDVSVKAELFGLKLTITPQTSDSIHFSGSGQANLDFDQITIDFVADDGITNDQVKAILTP